MYPFEYKVRLGEDIIVSSERKIKNLMLLNKNKSRKAIMIHIIIKDFIFKFNFIIIKFNFIYTKLNISSKFR